MLLVWRYNNVNDRIQHDLYFLLTNIVINCVIEIHTKLHFFLIVSFREMKIWLKWKRCVFSENIYREHLMKIIKSNSVNNVVEYCVFLFFLFFNQDLVVQIMKERKRKPLWRTPWVKPLIIVNLNKTVCYKILIIFHKEIMNTHKLNMQTIYKE